MAERTTRALLIVYALIAVMTFGHAFVRAYDEKLPEYKAIKEQGKVTLGSPEEAAGIGALLCGMAWPLYWSVQLARAADAGGKEGKP